MLLCSTYTAFSLFCAAFSSLFHSSLPWRRHPWLGAFWHVMLLTSLSETPPSLLVSTTLW